MKAWSVELAMLLVLGAAVTLAERRWREARAPLAAVSPAFGTLAPPSLVDPDSTAVAVDRVIERSPFTLKNSAAKPTPDSPPAAQPKAQPPTVYLKAIVGGPPWQAVMTGLPGRAGDVVVAPGDRFEAVVVRSIGRDAVVLAMPDTTWTISLAQRQP